MYICIYMHVLCLFYVCFSYYFAFVLSFVFFFTPLSFVFGFNSLTLGNNNVFVNNNNNDNNAKTSSLNTTNISNNNNHNNSSSSLVASSATSGSLRSLAPNKSTLFGNNAVGQGSGGGGNGANINSTGNSTSPSASASPSPPTKSPLLPSMKPNHGKPNFAPKPPGLQQLAMANGQRPAVARHHSMKSPRYKSNCYHPTKLSKRNKAYAHIFSKILQNKNYSLF